MTVKGPIHRHPRARRTQGFTLLEIIFSLAILGVATTVIMSLFSHSLVLGTTSRNLSTASTLAEEQLNDILRNPSAYDWTGLAGAAPGRFVHVKLVTPPEGKEPYGFGPPTALPGDASSEKRERGFYSKFRWTARAKPPAADSRCVEVTVIVHWKQGQQTRSLALTSLLPRQRLEGAA